VRPIREVAIWGRRPAQAEALARQLAVSLPDALGRPIKVRAVTDRKAAVGDAAVISCATLPKEPLVEGAWLREGQHIDLVGAFTSEMRESDDKAVWRARVYVDTRAGALKEAGDIVQAIGLQTPERVRLFAGGLQTAMPINARFRPEPGPVPGYRDPVVMSSGAFVAGATIELSCDAPLREPYEVYLQGGVVAEHTIVGSLLAAHAVIAAG